MEVIKRHKTRQERDKLLTGVNYYEHGLVFCQQNGQPLWPDNISKRQFRNLVEKAGLPRITFHDLRRTHATLLIAGGADPRQVANRIGHSSLTITLSIIKGEINVFPFHINGLMFVNIMLKERWN